MTIDLGPSAEQIETMRGNIFSRVSPSSEQVVRPAPNPRRTGRRIGFAALGVGAVAAALVLASVVAPIGAGGGATAEAAEFLASAAAATIETSDPVVEPGQYLRIATNAVYGASEGGLKGSWLAPSIGVLYIPADRTDEWVWERHPLPPTVFFGNTRDVALRHYQQTLGNPDLDAVLRADGGTFYDYPHRDYRMGEMPRDPAALRDHFYEGHIGGSASVSIDTDVWEQMTELLRTGEVPADLRAALYRAIALIPGVELIDDHAALDGRTGVALGRLNPAHGTRPEIIIDPRTGLMIGERTVTLVQRGEIPPGTVISSTSIETTVVDSAP